MVIDKKYQNQKAVKEARPQDDWSVQSQTIS